VRERWKEEHTAVNVAGRKNTVTAAMVLIAALSRSVARATVFESSATIFMAVLLRTPASAMRTDASASRTFSALSFCAIRLYSYDMSIDFSTLTKRRRTNRLNIAISPFLDIHGAKFVLPYEVL